MLDPQIDLVAVQVRFLKWMFNEAERKWTMESEAKNNSERNRAEREPREAQSERASEPASPSKAPTRHWPPHRRFWHRSPREWREETVKLES